MKSYSELIQLPYIRWFASPVRRGDVVVFNFPAGDTVINHPRFQSAIPYYDVKRIASQPGHEDYEEYRIVLADRKNFPLAIHPADKSDNYIKRCTGVAGDSITVRDNIVYYANREMEKIPPKSVILYTVTTNGQSLDPEVLKNEYDINFDLLRTDGSQANTFTVAMTDEAKNKMLQSGFAKQIVPYKTLQNQPVFPYDNIHKWTSDNFGPIWIPKKGATLNLTAENYSIYERAIRVYEKNEFEMKNGQFILNGQPVTSYTFKMDYYWMMGDNRQGSQDSRYWGFVPEDRIVGKAWLIWFSWEGGPRWNRLFRTVK
jgi:signal peptidase I